MKYTKQVKRIFHWIHHYTALPYIEEAAIRSEYLAMEPMPTKTTTTRGTNDPNEHKCENERK